MSRQIFLFRPPQTPSPESEDDNKCSCSFVGGEPTIQGTPFRNFDLTDSLAWRTNPKTEPEQRSEPASDLEKPIKRTPGTTTDDSFHSAPVLSEAAENLYTAILRKRTH
jgi:hypothetical protein